MKRFLIVFFFLSVNIVQGQNLVPNQSFEDTIYCPSYPGQIDACKFWFSAGMAFYTTPDYFNTCSSNPYVAPPDVSWGSQNPVTGNGYSFVGTYTVLSGSAMGKEYISCELLAPLIAGQEYFVSFYLSLGDRGGVTIASNKFGALFTTFPFNANNYAFPQNFAHVYEDSILTDTIDWFHFKKSFIADSNYTYITLGNFFDNNNVDTILTNNNLATFSGYFIDDVCVSIDSTLCFTSTDLQTTIGNEYFNLHPTIANEEIIYQSKSKIESLEIYNYSGEKCYSNFNPEKKSTIDVRNFAGGMYFLKVQFREHTIFRKFIVLK